MSSHSLSEHKNSINIEDYLKPKSLMPFCPICYSFPDIKILSAQPDKIEIHCSCGFDQVNSIKEYLSQLTHLQKENPKCELAPSHNDINAYEFCNQCNKWICLQCKKSHCDDHISNECELKIRTMCIKHIDKKYEYYCEDCKEHLCIVCKGEHVHHKIVILSEYIDDKEFEEIRLTIEKGNKYLKEYYTVLKDNAINKLKEEIKKIQFAFEHSFNVNNDILTLVSLFSESFHKEAPNYNIMKNIKANSSFQYRTFQPLENMKTLTQIDIDNMILFFNSNYIIKQDDEVDIDIIKELPPVDLSNLKDEITLTGFKGYINSLYLLNDGRFAVCSSEFQISIFTISLFQVECIIEGHSDTVTYVSQLEDGRLLSSSYDKTVKLWKQNDNKFIFEHSFEGHDNFVVKVIPLTNNRIASCSKDKKIKIWNVNTKELEATLLGHVYWVNCILKLRNRDILISGSATKDEKLRVWNLKTYQMTRMISNVSCCYRNSMIEYKDNKVLVGGHNRIRLVDLIDYVIERTIETTELGFICSFCELRDGSVICGCGSGALLHIDVNEESPEGKVVKEKAQSSDIIGIVNVDEERFISASEAHSIVLWNY